MTASNATAPSATSCVKRARLARRLAAGQLRIERSPAFRRRHRLLASAQRCCEMLHKSGDAAFISR